MAWFTSLPPWIAALPWLAIPLVIYVRFNASRRIREYAPARGTGVPHVSVIIPARNEAPNIERCVRSLLMTTYEHIEIIVVDDHSTDGTGDIARRAIAGDARARVTAPPPLADGWYGKQWACAHGASLATGEVLLFTDADTWHGPDVLGRAVTALRERKADLLTLLSTQEVGSFWEEVGIPPVFLGLYGVLGGTESVSRSRQPLRKAANGQYIMVTREQYDAMGGHEAVRMHVAEDIMLAQTWTRAGRTVHVVDAIGDVRTRMYRSMGEVYRGWRKNAWASGVPIYGKHRWLHVTTGVIAPLLPFLGLIPHAAFVLALFGVLPSWWMWFGAIGYVYETVMIAIAYRRMGFAPRLVFLYPLGCLFVSYIFAAAVLRGRRTEWKGREYQAA